MKNRDIPQLRFDPQGSVKTTLPETFPNFKKIECENCHGPALEHPSDPQKLTIDRSRELCLRCHTYLPYPTSKRAEMKGIDPDQHNPGGECVGCHNPHQGSKPQRRSR